MRRFFALPGRNRLFSCRRAWCMIIALISLLPLIQPLSAYAAPSSPDDLVSSYAYYNGIAKCMGGYEEISASDASAINSGSSDGTSPITRTTVNIGRYEAPGKGYMRCGPLIKNALELWGYGSFDDALKDWGYALQGDNWVYNHSGGSGATRAAAIIQKAYGGNTPSLGSPLQYMLYRKTLVDACKITGGKQYDTLSASEKAQVGKGKLIELTESQGTGTAAKTVRMVYTVGQNPDDSSGVNTEGTGGSGGAYVMPTNSGGIPTVMTCKELAAAMSRNAGAYNTAVQKGQIPADVAAAVGRNDQASSEGDAKSTCAIEGIGWIVCPVMNFLGNVAQDAFKLISDWFLVVDTSYTAGDSGTHTAWEVVRNLANVLFVVLFLIIIYSQVTGIGISNYGIKKVLPRIIVAAILINLSFIVCQIAVDVSNILGVNINSFMIGVANEVIKGRAGDVGGSVDSFQITDTIALAMVGGVAIYALFTVASIAALGAVIAFLLLILLLVMRKVLLIILIIVAPLAIVCMLLPNTEDFFKRWRTTFIRLLMVFPIISFFFGAGYLVRAVILTATEPISIQSVSSSEPNNSSDTGGN